MRHGDMSPQHPQTSTFIYTILGIVALFLSGMGWILASPMGSSPDEDFHMGSIWCPHPAKESCTVTTNAEGFEEILVPEPVAWGAKCHAFHPEISGACTTKFSNEREAPSLRYDNGSYPTGYYKFHHMFIGHRVARSILLMRFINLSIATLLIALTTFALQRRHRAPFLLGILVAWVPMGVYYVTSLNPSSWSVTGTTVYAGAFVASLTASTSRRRYLSLILVLLASILCMTSRGDSAAFIFVVSVALLCAIPWAKWKVIHKISAAALSLLGLYVMFSGGQADIVSHSQDVSGRGVIEILLRSLAQFPDYLSAFFGRGRGPGWFDTSFDSAPIAIVAIAVASGVVFAIFHSMNVRKALTLLMVSGAIFGIPFLTTVQGVQPEFVMYQPRYMLPLLAVFFFLGFVSSTKSSLPLSNLQVFCILLALLTVNFFALKRTIWRYIVGLHVPEPLFKLDSFAQWWWDIPLGPTIVWLTSSVCAALGALFVALALRSSAHSALAVSDTSDVPAAVQPSSEKIEEAVAEAPIVTPPLEREDENHSLSIHGRHRAGSFGEES